MKKTELKKITNALLQYHYEIAEFYSDYAKSVGLTFSSFKVLGILWSVNECTQAFIMKKSFLPKQTVNTIIRNFKEQNIIEELSESEKDKRNKIIKFTKYGKKYADDIMLKVENAECNAIDKIGKEKAELLIKIIDSYKNNLQVDKK